MAETNSNVEDKQIKQYKGANFGKRQLAKDVSETISNLEAQQAEASSKGKRRGLFGNVGMAVGSIALGALTGGASLLAQSAAVGAGAYAGSRAGRGIADATQKGGSLKRMRKLGGSLMSKSKEAQAGSFKSVLDAQERGARKGAMLAAAGSFMAGGGGQYIGKGLEKIGVPKEILQRSKTFNPSGVPAEEMRALYGTSKPGFEQASEVVVNPTASQSTYTGPASNIDFGGAGDIKQANLPIADPKPATAYTGSASQNRFLLESVGQSSQKSIVDTIKSGMVEGVTDSSMAGRASMFNRLQSQGKNIAGMSPYEAYMKEMM